MQTRTSSPGAPTAVRGGAGVLLSVGAAVTVGTLPVFLVGGLAVQITAELGLSVTLLGLAGSMFFASSALVARPLAAVTERVGPTAAMRLAAAGSALCLIALGFTPSTPWLLVVLCLAGIPTSLSQPAANELLMSLVPEHRRGLGFAVKQSAIPVSTLLAGLAVPTLALTVGWRWVFLLAGALGLLTVFVVPRMHWHRTTRAEAGEGGSAGLLLVALAAVTGLGSAAANAMGTFVTVTAVHIGYQEATAGLVLSLGSAVGLAVRLAAGAVADHRRPDLLRMVTIMLALGGVGYLLLAVGHPAAFLIGLVLGFGAGWAWPGVFNYAVALRFPDRVATATSVTQTGVYAGAAAGPLLFGLVVGHFGVSAAWLTCAMLVAVSTATLLVVRARS
jgi:MFS family permease